MKQIYVNIQFYGKLTVHGFVFCSFGRFPKVCFLACIATGWCIESSLRDEAIFHGFVEVFVVQKQSSKMLEVTTIKNAQLCTKIFLDLLLRYLEKIKHILPNAGEQW